MVNILNLVENWLNNNLALAEEFAEEIAENSYLYEDEDGKRWNQYHVYVYVWHNAEDDTWNVSQYEDEFEGAWELVAEQDVLDTEAVQDALERCEERFCDMRELYGYDR